MTAYPQPEAVLRRDTVLVAPFVVTLPLLLSLTLIRLPILVADKAGTTFYAVTLAPLLLAICALYLKRDYWQASSAVYWCWAFIGLLILAALRAVGTTLTQRYALLETVQLLTLATLGAFAFLREPREDMRHRYVRALLWAPSAFLATNVAMYVANIMPDGQTTADSGTSATIFGFVGYHTDRVIFPLSGGLNGIAPTAVVALVISAVMVRANRHSRLAWSSLGLALYVMLAIDSRGALLFSILTLALMWLVPRGRQRGLSWVALLLPIIPVVLILGLTSLGGTTVGSSLNRNNSASVETGTGRTVVWKAVVSVFEHPSIGQLYGYGQDGQLASGASEKYAYLFPGDPKPLLHSAHNMLLQTLLDTGWTGFIVLIGLAAAVFRRLGRLSAIPEYQALLAGGVGLILAGVVQAAPTFAAPDSLAFWVLLIFAAARAQPTTR